ncbi:DUF7674 family protein [Sphingobacterium sp. MYb382]|uniref:DUF7674 family protein n=1 Tax=Sphingobacterium sp. MYb382 TaxID=2745278 RepID=UPI0030ACBDC5
MKKLNYVRASYYIAQHFSAIRMEVKQLRRQRNFAGVLQALINHLRELQTLGDLDLISRHLNYLGRIHAKGNAYVQYLMENLFVRSLRSFQRLVSPEAWQELYRKMPKLFIAVYEKQINEQRIQII